jgi:hypothetical protein
VRGGAGDKKRGGAVDEDIYSTSIFRNILDSAQPLHCSLYGGAVYILCSQAVTATLRQSPVTTAHSPPSTNGDQVRVLLFHRAMIRLLSRVRRAGPRPRACKATEPPSRGSAHPPTSETDCFPHRWCVRVSVCTEKIASRRIVDGQLCRLFHIFSEIRRITPLLPFHSSTRKRECVGDRAPGCPLGHSNAVSRILCLFLSRFALCL